MAITYSQVPVQVHEVSLKNKPETMLALSPKGTVPVLHCSNGRVIEQSLDIMVWALEQNDPAQWLSEVDSDLSKELIAANDGAFKHWLDRYKYFERYPDQSQIQYREQAEQALIARLESALSKNQFLCGDLPKMTDVAIFPFIRQFAAVDTNWFESSRWLKTIDWLKYWTQSELFAKVMSKAV